MSSCARSQGRGATTRRPALMGAVTGLLLLTGCAVGGESGGSASPEPRAELAQRAEVAAVNREQGQAGDGNGRAASAARPAPRRTGNRLGGDTEQVGPTHTGAGRTAPEPRGPTGGPRPDDAPPVADWPVLVTVADPTVDHGSGPGYADLAGTTFSEHDDRLAVSVTVAEPVPGRLAEREVQGVGIDLFRSRSDESDYQIFLDGGVHGWRAFLQTPGGFVRFPGTFSVRGRTFEVVLPWSSLGGRADAEVSVFADWSSGVGRLSADGTSRTGLLQD